MHSCKYILFSHKIASEITLIYLYLAGIILSIEGNNNAIAVKRQSQIFFPLI